MAPGHPWFRSSGQLPWPEVGRATLEHVAASLQCGPWAIAAPYGTRPSSIDEVEQLLAELFRTRYCATTCNGTAAIVIALQALGIGPGHRVLVPALTWVACSTAILRVGASPVFVDSGRDSPLMSPVPARVGPIDAILAAHLHASQVDIAELRRQFPGVPVIEDCSHSQGFGDPDLHAFGDIRICSFQASKILTCGEGGAAFTDDPHLARRLEALRADSRVRPEDDARRAELESSRTKLTCESTVHGTNLAMSELSASILSEQLGRFDEQTLRRARGVAALRRRLDPRFELVGDEPCLASGRFYGVILRAPSAELARQVRSSCPPWSDVLYDPIPHSKLHRPDSIANYASIAIGEVSLDNAQDWTSRAIVLPHEFFLAPEQDIEAFATSLSVAAFPPAEAACAPVAARPQDPLPAAPPIDVLVLTNGRRDTLGRALASVAAQSYRGSGHAGPADRGTLRVVVVHDGARRPVPAPEGLELCEVRLDIEGALVDRSCIGRVATLRNLALQLVQAPLFCFLDDDNAWRPDHLSTLWQTMRAQNAPAVHAWRTLVEPDGSPWAGDRFPWLPQGEIERERYLGCLQLGILERGSPVVRDAVTAPHRGHDLGMVDLGAWLFRRSLFEVLAFPTSYSREEKALRTGEDDRLLRRLRALRIPIACSEQPTLVYTLGGISNSGIPW